MKQVRQRTLLLLTADGRLCGGRRPVLCASTPQRADSGPRSPPTTTYTRTGGWLWDRS